jgi:hypothetical protein
LKAGCGEIGLIADDIIVAEPYRPGGDATGVHLTPEGYHMLAQELVGPVAAALRR